MSDLHDVIVAGAGFTGLSAAMALRDSGLSCAVLEARGRVGGRVEAELNGLGETIDTGGQFLCDDMPSVLELAHRYGKTLVEPPVEGKFEVVPADGVASPGDYYAGVDAIRRRMRHLDPGDQSVRDISVADWLATQSDEATKKAGFRSVIQGLWCRSLDEIPLWYLVDCEHRITNRMSELQYFIGETMHSLAADMAAELDGALYLAMPVETVSHAGTTVEVAAGGRTFQGRRLILAMPPSRAAALSFSPALPDRLAAALGAWQPGTVIKIFLRFESAFWRDTGSNGTVMWHDPNGLYVCDASHAADRPGLVMFVGGPLAVEWRAGGEDAIRNRAVNALAEVWSAAPRPIDFNIRDWTGDRWSGGAYSDLVLARPAYDAEHVLVEGHAGIVFAASELSPSFPGYIEGAIVAGRIAADKVAQSLGVQSLMATRASGS